MNKHEYTAPWNYPGTYLVVRIEFIYLKTYLLIIFYHIVHKDIL